jgi:hypothetical protein
LKNAKNKNSNAGVNIAVNTPNMQPMLSESRWAPEAEATTPQNGFAASFTAPASGFPAPPVNHSRVLSGSAMDVEMTGSPSILDTPLETLSMDPMNAVLMAMPTLAESRWATPGTLTTSRNVGFSASRQVSAPVHSKISLGATPAASNSNAGFGTPSAFPATTNNFGFDTPMHRQTASHSNAGLSTPSNVPAATNNGIGFGTSTLAQAAANNNAGFSASSHPAAATDNNVGFSTSSHVAYPANSNVGFGASSPAPWPTPTYPLDAPSASERPSLAEVASRNPSGYQTKSGLPPANTSAAWGIPFHCDDLPPPTRPWLRQNTNPVTSDNANGTTQGFIPHHLRTRMPPGYVPPHLCNIPANLPPPPSWSTENDPPIFAPSPPKKEEKKVAYLKDSRWAS